MSTSTAAQPIRALAGPFPGALDVQPLPSSFLLLVEFRSSCWGTEAPWSYRRPAESGRTPAGPPRCLSCPTCGPLEAAPHAPLNLQMSPALLPPGRDGVYPKGSQGETLPTQGAQMRLHLLNPLCRVFFVTEHNSATGSGGTGPEHLWGSCFHWPCHQGPEEEKTEDKQCRRPRQPSPAPSQPQCRRTPPVPHSGLRFRAPGCHHLGAAGLSGKSQVLDLSS